MVSPKSVPPPTVEGFWATIEAAWAVIDDTGMRAQLLTSPTDDLVWHLDCHQNQLIFELENILAHYTSEQLRIWEGHLFDATMALRSQEHCEFLGSGKEFFGTAGWVVLCGRDFYALVVACPEWGGVHGRPIHLHRIAKDIRSERRREAMQA
ncbi:hypothetical protein CspeluHIS016_0803550 [Cutaneotrichosporon spelunceum]|uniref:Uncharacterized protein n=1 Tax=Cutaneotrichosporon spelunceum TaxID=1672016 RepID=A0AAD3U040_9TREE|nr:hypothetical protein CspeluHIS016_0803550 [Cutaneotrichosporon spelunceum]